VTRTALGLLVFVVAPAFAKAPAPVTGKALYDIGHAPADHSNRRSTPKGYAVWEIHPVMKMEVIP